MNGCHNRREFVKSIEMSDSTHFRPRPEIALMPMINAIFVPFVMSRRCEYTRSSLGQADAGCLGCRHRSNVKEEK